jgi:hypothetical protein
VLICHARHVSSSCREFAALFFIERSERISRTALSDKTSRLRPRHVVSKPGQTHERVTENTTAYPDPGEFECGFRARTRFQLVSRLALNQCSSVPFNRGSSAATCLTA